MSQKNFVSFGDAETLFTELGDKLTPTFTGTVAEWEALSTAEKIKYKQAVFTDDYSDNPVGNLSALTTTDKSSAVGAINEVNTKIARNKYVNSTMSPQATINADVEFMTHKLVIPEYGTYLVMGEILGVGGNVAFRIREGESLSGNTITSSCPSQNKCLFTVTTRNANEILSLWIIPDSNQTFYSDSKAQRFIAIKLL